MPYRAPELFDVKTGKMLDEKVDIWVRPGLLAAADHSLLAARCMPVPMGSRHSRPTASQCQWPLQAADTAIRGAILKKWSS
jgi:hypothetical protein